MEQYLQTQYKDSDGTVKSAQEWIDDMGGYYQISDARHGNSIENGTGGIPSKELVKSVMAENGLILSTYNAPKVRAVTVSDKVDPVRVATETERRAAFNHGWTITKSFLDCPQTIVYDAETTKALPHRFQLADGDDIVYFEGISSDDSSFKPLDEWATGDYGCTDILYWNDNTSKFEPL
jgi:hypothetical protein